MKTIQAILMLSTLPMISFGTMMAPSEQTLMQSCYKGSPLLQSDICWGKTYTEQVVTRRLPSFQREIDSLNRGSMVHEFLPGTKKRPYYSWNYPRYFTSKPTYTRYPHSYINPYMYSIRPMYIPSGNGVIHY